MIKAAPALMLLATALITVASAQSQPAVRAPEPRIYEFKNLDTVHANAVVSLIQEVAGSVRVHLNGPLNLVTLQGGTQADLDRAEELLRKYDVPHAPRPQVKFTAYLIQAGAFAKPAKYLTPRPPAVPADTQPEPLSTSRPIPAELQSVVAEMKRTFAYDSYSLLDVVETDVRGNAEYEGTLPGSTAGHPNFYTLSYNSVGVSADEKTVSVSQFEFMIKFPYGSMLVKPEYGVNRIKTEIAIHEGQKLVIGKLRLRPGTDVDVFLVLTAKVE